MRGRSWTRAGQGVFGCGPYARRVANGEALPLMLGLAEDIDIAIGETAKDDSDLDPIRHEPAFKQLISD